jgi:hypothetical protein
MSGHLKTHGKIAQRMYPANSSNLKRLASQGPGWQSCNQPLHCRWPIPVEIQANFTFDIKKPDEPRAGASHLHQYQSTLDFRETASSYFATNNYWQLNYMCTLACEGTSHTAGAATNTTSSREDLNYIRSLHSSMISTWSKCPPILQICNLHKTPPEFASRKGLPF